MKIYQRILLVVFLVPLFTTAVMGREFVGDKQKQSKTVKASTAGCSAAAAYLFLDVNNVRCRVNTGGDMWWDLGAGVGSQYYIPANTTKTSLFAGSLWIGGVDVNDQLKIAALRFRQVGNDYWTGPLTIDGTASIDAEVCAEYDKFFPMTRAMVDQFIGYNASTNKADEYPGYSVPDAIKDWPAHGDASKHQSNYLAPFYDMNGNGVYEWEDGDYPYYDIPNELCHSDIQTKEGEEGIVIGGILADQVLKGDETLWWVFNDKGNYHSESKGQSIGLEIRAQAFGFATNDEINNMTFYSYEIINRSTFELADTYFAPWTDADLGYAQDDYVGCDVERGMGYCYNGKAIDGSGEIEAYGDQPPAVGIDFFQGPYLDPDGYDNPSFKGDGILGPSFAGDCSIVNFDSTVIQMTYGKEGETKTANFLVNAAAINGVNFGNGIEDDERFGMRRFLYHNNDGSVRGDPSTAPQYYNYLRGYWKDGSPMNYGGTAYPGDPGTVGPQCDFMFPGDSDPCNWGTGGAPPNGGYNQNGLYWNEVTAGNNPFDRRFMQSAGPFTLMPGAVNYITFGVPWAKAISGGAWASVELLRVVDDKCQALFDNCFKVLDGPDAPDLTIQELENELVIYVTNKKLSNNYKEGYNEQDITIKTGDPYYRFEGYQVFQLKNADVTAESLYDPDQARLVFQCDIKNGVTKLVNHVSNQAIGFSVPQIMVQGGDEGIKHTFRVNEDQFASGQRALVNHKQYYYMAVAYAHNEYKPYTVEPTGLDGQKKPYLAGRKNIKVYTGIPHMTINGLVTQANFGDGPVITRVEGQGNGGVSLEFSQATIDEILSKPMADPIANPYGSADYPISYKPTYTKGHGPLDIEVIDPLSVKSGKFSLKLIDNEEVDGVITHANWKIWDQYGNTYYSDTTISVDNEQLLLDLGIAVQVYNVGQPGDSLAVRNGLIESEIVYADSSRPWIAGVYDNNVPSSPQNWIRAGTYYEGEGGNSSLNDWGAPENPVDPNEYYEKVINGMWSPYSLVAYSDQSDKIGPAIDNTSKNYCPIKKTASVDIVLTPDQTKWSRAIVIEMCPDAKLSEGGAKRFEIRKGLSVNKDGTKATLGAGASENINDPNFISETGFGWFPGYAINLETGERLNIAFGEDSWLSGHNGRDMKWNPTSSIFENNNPVFGGKHYVYVLQHTEVKIGDSIYKFEAYDGCRSFYNVMNRQPQIVTSKAAFASSMWVGMPIMDRLNRDNWLSNDVRFRLRVSKPYNRYYSMPLEDGVVASENDHFPLYNFDLTGMEPSLGDPVKTQTDLDKVNIVPNPYYAYSSYETSTLDNRVKITNLPRKCVVTIYNISGTLIRQFSKDDPTVSIDWDLKNFAGIPIAGGVYIMHIKSDDGERIVKWFGALRPVDLNTF